MQLGLGLGLGFAQQARWAPSALGSGLLAWFDASNPAGLTLSGSDVISYNDLSGSGHHAEQAAYFVRHAARRRAAGSAALVGTIAKDSFEEDATWDITRATS